MGAQQSTPSGDTANVRPATPEGPVFIDDPSTLKAHAIDCCSIASSYQSLSELDDFFRPGGDTALGRYSVRSMAAASEIVANTIFEGDELHALAEEAEQEQEQHIREESSSSQEPVPVAAASASSAVQPSSGGGDVSDAARAAVHPVAPPTDTQVVAALVATVFAAVKAAYDNGTASDEIAAVQLTKAAAAAEKSLAPALSSALSAASTQGTDAREDAAAAAAAAADVTAIVSTVDVLPRRPQPQVKLTLAAEETARPYLEVAASLASASSGGPLPSSTNGSGSSASPGAGGPASRQTSACSSFGSAGATAAAAAAAGNKAAVTTAAALCPPPERLRSHHVADLNVSFSEDDEERHSAGAAGQPGAASSGSAALLAAAAVAKADVGPAITNGAETGCRTLEEGTRKVPNAEPAAAAQAVAGVSAAAAAAGAVPGAAAGASVAAGGGKVGAEGAVGKGGAVAGGKARSATGKWSAGTKGGVLSCFACFSPQQ